jgi:uncharacterized protein YndB with AHSA1/START domain
MTTPSGPASIADRELRLERLIGVPADRLFRAWTEPDLLVQWFTPRPWTVARAELDVRPGGANLIVMRSPEGVEFPNRGVYLEVVRNRRLVWTDAYVDAWTPSEKPFITAAITFTPEAEGTRYAARVLHWSVADREAHERMGFQAGWALATDQLAALAARL